MAHAQDSPDLDHINLQYHGGPLLEHVQVSTLFWGSSWNQNSLSATLRQFYPALFADGRYMANLAQYNAGGYQIGNGTSYATTIDAQDPSARVTDEQIQAELRAQVAAGTLPQPDPDTLYVVFTPPQVVVVDAEGDDSAHDLAGYHDYFFDGRGGGFAYAVIPYNSAAVMTVAASHELSEAVTDPQPTQDTLGWYDTRNGEVADIVVLLYSAGRIGILDFVDVLQGADGTSYLVQKVWSARDGEPVAFAAASGG